MNNEDLQEIRQIIREEIGSFLREVYRPDERFSHPRTRRNLDDELSRLAMLNDQFYSFMKAGDLMKGCKYEKNKVDTIASDVANIDSKT